MQMVAISRALLGAPGLVLFDEPSQGLAPKVVQDVMRTIRAPASDEGVAVLVVEQNVAQRAGGRRPRLRDATAAASCIDGPAAALRDDAALRAPAAGRDA